jgi:hypothetical protein
MSAHCTTLYVTCSAVTIKDHKGITEEDIIKEEGSLYVVSS